MAVAVAMAVAVEQLTAEARCVAAVLPAERDEGQPSAVGCAYARGASEREHFAARASSTRVSS